MCLMGQFETIVPNEIGPCEGLDGISYKVLWASPSVLANGGIFVKAPRTFDGATCTKVNWRRVSMKESSNKVELD